MNYFSESSTFKYENNNYLMHWKSMNMYSSRKSGSIIDVKIK
jgi:hypothetical protein